MILVPPLFWLEVVNVLADTYEISAVFDLTGATATEFGFRLHAEGGAIVWRVESVHVFGLQLPAPWFEGC